MAGIKETKEVIAAVGLLKDLIVAELGNGFQPTDIPKIGEKFLQSPEFVNALAGIEQLLPELKDLDLSEKISLALDVVKAAT